MKSFKIAGSVMVILVLFLAGCTGQSIPTQPPAAQGVNNTPSTTTVPQQEATSEDTGSTPSAPDVLQQETTSSDLVRTDAQGAVTFEVNPVNLDSPGDTLVFDVTMDTHSIDLSMDLAALATLTTDNGQTVQGTQWDAPRGGHHVEGNLIFPATSDGKPLLEGAKELTLTIKDVDAPARVFTWQITR